MKIFMESLYSLGTGLAVGVIFAFMRMPIPAPAVIQGVAGILGITLGYLLFERIFR